MWLALAGSSRMEWNCVEWSRMFHVIGSGSGGEGAEPQMTWQQLAGAAAHSSPSPDPPPRWMLTEMVFSYRGS